MTRAGSHTVERTMVENVANVVSCFGLEGTWRPTRVNNLNFAVRPPVLTSSSTGMFAIDTKGSGIMVFGSRDYPR